MVVINGRSQRFADQENTRRRSAISQFPCSGRNLPANSRPYVYGIGKSPRHRGNGVSRHPGNIFQRGCHHQFPQLSINPDLPVQYTVLPLLQYPAADRWENFLQKFSFFAFYRKTFSRFSLFPQGKYGIIKKRKERQGNEIQPGQAKPDFRKTASGRRRNHEVKHPVYQSN